MTQIYQYAVAALFIEFIIIFFYFQKRSLPTFQNIVFLVILAVIILATLLELQAGYMEDNFRTVNLELMWFIECMYFTMNISFSMLFAVYNFSAFDIYGKINRNSLRVLQTTIFTPYVLCLILIWLTPVFKDTRVLVFSIDLVNGYQRGNNFWFNFFCTVKAFYIILLFVIVMVFHSVIPRSKIKIMFYYVVTTSATALMQLFHQGLLTDSFGMACATLVYFFFIQKPEELLDTVTGTLNQTALLRALRYSLAARRHFSCVAVYVDDTMFIANTFGINQLNNFLTDVGGFLQENFSYANVFSRQQGCFFIILKE